MWILAEVEYGVGKKPPPPEVRSELGAERSGYGGEGQGYLFLSMSGLQLGGFLFLFSFSFTRLGVCSLVPGGCREILAVNRMNAGVR